MKAQYTSGPWSIECALSSDAYNIRYITGPDCQKICDVNHRVEMSQEEALANARLIAKSPILLAALNECITDAGSCAMSRHAVGDAIRRLEAINEIARAAINEAIGAAA